jgi:hypothetical protein
MSDFIKPEQSDIQWNFVPLFLPHRGNTSDFMNGRCVTTKELIAFDWLFLLAPSGQHIGSPNSRIVHIAP